MLVVLLASALLVEPPGLADEPPVGPSRILAPAAAPEIERLRLRARHTRNHGRNATAVGLGLFGVGLIGCVALTASCAGPVDDDGEGRCGHEWPILYGPFAGLGGVGILIAAGAAPAWAIGQRHLDAGISIAPTRRLDGASVAFRARF